MRRAADSVLTKVSVVVFVTLTIFVCAVRPIAHPSGRLYPRSGLTRMSLLSESADTDSTSAPAPAFAVARVVRLVVAVGLPLLVLKRRRMALRPVPRRRLKRPLRRAHSVLLSD